MTVLILKELFVKQLVQKYINDGSSEDLFNEDELDDEYDSDY